MQKKKLELLNACEHENIEDTISISIGLDFDSDGSKNIYDLLQHADDQMYEMKNKVSKDYKDKIIEYIKLQNKFIR